MIDSVAGGSASRPHFARNEITLDGLTQVRAEEGRQMAIAASQAQHQEKVRMAVEKYMKWPSENSAGSAVSLSLARAAYGEV